MAVTTAKLTQFKGDLPARVTTPMAANTIVYKGAMVQQDANGRAINAVAGNGLPVVCVPDAIYDNRTGSEAGGAADAITCVGTAGIFGFAVNGTAAKAGDVVYCYDNVTVTLDSNSGANGFAGVVTEVRDGVTYVLLGTHVNGLLKFMAAYVAAAIAAIP